MALPVTITGVALDLATVGPYQSSAGNYYFFGKDASSNTVLRCMKASDPTVSWSSVATDSGFVTGIIDLVGQKDGDIVHLIVVDGVEFQPYALKYRTFNMSTESFVISETIIAEFSGPSVPPMCSMAIRSGSNPVVGYQVGDHINYTRRTGTNTWDGPTQVDDGDSGYTYYSPVAILGVDNAVHFLYYSLGTAQRTYQRTLSSGNSLQTSTYIAGANYLSEGISLSFGSATRCFAVPTYGYAIYFDSSDTPALVKSFGNWTINQITLRVFEEGGIIYVLYSKNVSGNQDYYFMSSDDGGAHWSAETYICSSTNNHTLSSTSRFSKIYSAAGEMILPFLYADNSGTELKHNHKVTRSTILQGLASFLGSGIFQSTGFGGDFTAPLEDPFRLRFSILNEADSLGAAPWQLYVSKNGGAYHAVTTTSDDARSVNAGSSPDETQIMIPRLTIPV